MRDVLVIRAIKIRPRFASTSRILVAGLLVAEACLCTSAQADVCVYVAAIGSGDVSVIDSATNTVRATIPVGNTPDGVAALPNGHTVYVANAGSNSVSVIDSATNAVTATIGVGQNPIGIGVSPDGAFAYVANFATPGSVSIIDTATNTVVATVPVAAGPYAVAVTPDGTSAYVFGGVGNVVSVIDTATKAVSPTITVGSNPSGGALTPNGSFAYVTNQDSNSVSVIDTSTKTVIATIPVGPNPLDVAVTPDGTAAYVANIGLASVGDVSVIDTATNTVVKTIMLGNHPDGVAISPDGTTAYVGTTGCCGGPNTVTVINTATNIVSGTIPVGMNPVAVAVASVPGACGPLPTPPPTPTIAPTNIDAGKAVGRPGGTACLPITLLSGATNAATTMNDLGFDSTRFSFTTCTINPAVTGFGLNKMLTLTPIDAGTVRAAVSDANGSPIPDGLLYTCTLGVTPGTAAASYSVANTPTASDQTGVAIPNVVGSAGQVIVTNCTGDCNGDGRVKIGEVIRCVNLFLGQPLCSFTDPALNCPVADASLDGHVSVGEVIQCVNRFLNGC